MSITLKNRWLFLALLLVLGGTLALGWRLGMVRAERASKPLVDALNSEISAYKITIRGLEMSAYEKDQLVITQKQALESSLIEKEKLKKLHFKAVNEATSLKAEIAILKDSLSHNGVITIIEPCDSVGYSYPVIKLPFTFKDGNEDYILSGGFSETGIMNIDLNVPVILDIWTGKDKQTKDYKVVVTTPNKVVKITELRSVKLDLPKVKRIGIGVQAGYGIGKNGLTPYIGAGISYNIFRF